MVAGQPRHPGGSPERTGGRWNTRERASSDVDLGASGGWPALGREAQTWIPAEGTLSRRAHTELAGEYHSAITPAVADVEPRLSAAVTTRVSEATTEMARFDAEASFIFGDSEIAPITSVLLRSESAASSQIEHLSVGARQLALAELPGLGAEASRNARTVSANVRAMQAALDLADDVSEPSILAMHETLLHDQNYAMPGRYRDAPVWIGGRAPTEAAFVPPAHERVPAAMADLVALAQPRDIPALAHVALVHAQFETIHPFVDGNGRTGRALAQSMLRGAGVTRRITVPVSAGLLADTDGYFRALGAYRDGDIEPIVLTFADAAETAVANGRRLVTDLHEIRETWKQNVTARRDAAVWRTLDVIVGQPVVDTRHVQSALGVSFPTAQVAIETLQEAGILRQSVVGRQRNRIWHAPEVLEALDAFATRAGRRQG